MKLRGSKVLDILRTAKNVSLQAQEQGIDVEKLMEKVRTNEDLTDAEMEFLIEEVDTTGKELGGLPESLLEREYKSMGEPLRLRLVSPGGKLVDVVPHDGKISVEPIELRIVYPGPDKVQTFDTWDEAQAVLPEGWTGYQAIGDATTAEAAKYGSVEHRDLLMVTTSDGTKLVLTAESVVEIPTTPNPFSEHAEINGDSFLDTIRKNKEKNE